MKASGMAWMVVAWAGGATTLAAYGQTPYEGGDSHKGQGFALEVCTPCHVVSKEQRSPPRFADAPAFSAIANARGMTATALAAFLGSPHPTMPNLILSADEQRDVISYIISLQTKR
jgi:cytochrome c2